ncbi:ras-related protein Rab-32 [Hyalella azteca]|uniref:Ras-related protein Rab n=1 Tax=Hyalella azteca TaxID=294128 RepID=A0A8B7N351_HYAAZ|nr:ras-related protein Rab-32 [Hyalella azteca]
MTSVAPEESLIPRELQYKVLVIGEYGVGKTAIIQRYTKGYFSPNYKLTIGVDFAVKTLIWNAHTKINLQLWDIAGHERFGQLTRVYYKYAVAALVVFDVTRPCTLDAVAKWVYDVREKVSLSSGDGATVPVVVLANKCDVMSSEQERRVYVSSLQQFCEQHSIDAWFLTSAKEDINIDETMRWLVDHILTSRRTSQLSMSPPNQPTTLLADPHPKPQSYCCR